MGAIIILRFLILIMLVFMLTRDNTAEGNFLVSLSKEEKGFTHSSSVLFYGSKPKDMEFIQRLLNDETEEESNIVDDKQVIINNQKARQVRFERNENGATMTKIFVIFEDKDRSLLLISGEMEKGSTELDIFSDICSSIKLNPIL